jgi:hypothetical protein
MLMQTYPALGILCCGSAAIAPMLQISRGCTPPYRSGHPKLAVYYIKSCLDLLGANDVVLSEPACDCWSTFD